MSNGYGRARAALRLRSDFLLFTVVLIGQGAWGEGSIVGGLQNDSKCVILSSTLSRTRFNASVQGQ